MTMDSLYGSDRKLGDLDDSGVSEFLLDQDIFPASSNMFQVLTSGMKDQAKGEQTDRAASPELFNWCPEIKLSTENYVDNDWFNSFLEDPVLNDKMITDAVQSPRITSDHSYSLNNDQSLTSPLSSLCKMDDFGKDIDTDIFDSNHGALDLSQKNYSPAQIIIKQEPSEKEKIANSTRANNNTNTATVANITNIISNNSNSCNNIISAINTNITNISEDDNNIINDSNSIDSPLSNSTTLPTSNVQPTLIFSTTTSCPVKTETPILPNISIKSEPTEFMDTSSDHSGYESMNLPPTPPSSNTSDSEGSFSPLRSAPSSPVRPVSTAKSLPSNNTKHISQPLFTNPIPQSGYLILSEEEKRTLIAEGYPIPGKLPLTKQEEKNLKKIRRKIKNKISAQESRRKKKEYLETLEKQVEAFTQENVDLKKKVDSLETNNRSLIGQLQKLQAQCGKIPRSSSASSTQTGTVLM
ncbi:AMP-responsive element-binding 3 1 isoform X1 [Octopus vulgaris]|nr:AMP-responsive element-binding 3 1 isoform X1 [Octopus vulgaris]